MDFTLQKFSLRSSYMQIVLVILSLAGFAGAYKYFKYATPIINIDIPITGNQAVEKANEIVALQDTWHVTDQAHALSFEQAAKVQNFAELECGGVQSFIEMIDKKLYSPYRWHIRYFKELDPYEVHVYLNPDGTGHSFEVKLPETLLLPELSTAQARTIACHEAKENWNIDFNLYEEIESSQNILPNGRIDHIFVYKRTDAILGNEGQYRILLGVAGNQVVSIVPHVHIPESFIKKFENMRSANMTLSAVLSLLMVALYLVGGLLCALYFLIKNKRINSTTSLSIAGGAAILACLSSINELPAAYMGYSTALSFTNYYLIIALNIFRSGFGTFISIFTLCSVTEGLDRWAFPDHLQFFKIFTQQGMRSKNFVQQTFFAYLMVGIMLGFTTISYYFFVQHCGWWCPANILADPNILTHYAPWFTPFFKALQAGFTEEMLFRVLPLAGLMVAGKYFKKERLFLLIAMIIQAILFAGAHVNYPQMPAYFRLIELLPISLFFGGIYLRFGLYPAVLIHTLYDLILMSTCIFASHAIHTIMQQILLIGIIILPLLICAYLYCRSKLQEAAASMYNRAWQATSTDDNVTIRTSTQYQNYGIVSKHTKIFWTGLMLLLMISSIGLISTYKNNFTQLTMSRQEAINQAKKYLIADNKTVDDWTIEANPCTIPSDPYTPSEHTYVWQTGGESCYKNLIGSYLSDSFWHTRCVRFTGTLQERIEQYEIDIAGKGESVASDYSIQEGKIVRLSHHIPEDAPGEFLSKAEARGKALEALKNLYDISLNDIRELSVVEKDRPNHSLFTFTFQDMRPTTQAMLSNTQDQARITIVVTGDQISGYGRTIFIPEDWKRQEFDRATAFETYSMFIAIVLLLCCLLASIDVLHVSMFSFSLRRLALWIAGCSSFILIEVINKLPLKIIHFSPTIPLFNQLITQAVGIFALIIMIQMTTTIFASQLGKKISLFTRFHTAHTIGLQGILIGAIITGIASWSSYFSPHFAPNPMIFTKSLEVYGTYIRLLGCITQNLLPLFVNCTTGMVLLHAGARLQKPVVRWIYLTTISFLISFQYMVANGMDALPYILLCSAFTTILIVYALRSMRIISPLIAIPAYMVITTSDILKHLMLDPYILTISYGICGLTAFLSIGYWWFMYLYKLDQERVNQESV